ncbi:methionyl-tRNA formyltransferase [Ilumatobacter sp.]|uniref:methionyl-tRNA formyltransferase n=1 Tax=Ilumatobacter sp. TaxID=1967498 RepID=UPI003AF67466
MRSERARVLLVGRGPTAGSALEGLATEFEVCAIVRDGDDDTTRRARALDVPVIDDVSVASVRNAVTDLAPDAVVVSSYDRILDAELVARCPFVNVHYAPLPRGRGRATVNWAIINGDDTAAITIHHLVAGLDAGGILFQDTVPITDTSTVTGVYDDLNDLQRRHIAAATARAIDGDPGTSQDADDATYYCTRIPDDGEIDWSSDTAAIDRLVRALQPPFPHAFTWLGLERLHVVSALPVADAPTYEGRIPGRVVRVDRSTGEVDVLTGDGVLRLRTIHTGDDQPLSAASKISSVRFTLGLRVADLVDLIDRSAEVDR